MRVVVFAYHNMGIAGLQALQRAGYEIVSIFSHEDDPDENCWFGSVKEWAGGREIPVHCPGNVNEPEWVSRIAALRPEMIFSFYCRYMLSREILTIADRGAFNLHGSLLPAYRGRCPVNWVIVNGERQTGVTLHYMVEKADAGDIVGQKVVSIDRMDTAVTLYHKLCLSAGVLLDEVLPLMKEGKAPRLHQEISNGSYFGGRRPEDGRIDWHWPAERIYNLIRAVTEPYPGAFCTLSDHSRLFIWRALPDETMAVEEVNPPGKVFVEGNRVLAQTGRGRLQLLEVEIEKKRVSGESLIPLFQGRGEVILS
jgi:methionyl-tRNA formyltransferase